MNLLEMNQRKAALNKTIVDLKAKIDAEKRGMTPEEVKALNKFLTEVEKEQS
jgi:hypothetical protein